MKLVSEHRENIIIIAIWGLVYASTPLYMYYALLSIGQEFDWRELWSVWLYVTAFLVLFALNHYILIPRLINKKHTGRYIASIAVALALFIAFLVVNKPQGMPSRRAVNSNGTMPQQVVGEELPRAFTLPLTPPDMARLTMAILMIGVDLGAAAFLNSLKMRQRLLLLEQQTLLQELEHLHYQINPHFFMNTLNNIHALVDLDQERAKRAIVELSGLMRYALYEGNGNMAMMSKEMTFLELYISLMKLRYSNKVEVRCEMPDGVPSNIMMPPLLLVTFVENAFKHGISYLEKSFIHIDLHLEDDNSKICFSCVNSRHPQNNSTNDGHHGIGLENVRKRLDLQYSGKYQLDINDSDETLFSVNLVIPTCF